MKVKVAFVFLVLRLLRRIDRGEKNKEIYREPSSSAPPGWPTSRTR
jgi:hypothetical protein